VIRVVLSYPNGQQTESLLSGIPRHGEFIRLRNGRQAAATLEVESVTWLEGDDASVPEPSVLIKVRVRGDTGP
jgi:hypothetical protein